VKVVQELMRHAKISTTMEIYAQAGMEHKRVAQRKAVDLLMGRNQDRNQGPLPESRQKGMFPDRSQNNGFGSRGKGPKLLKW
jgi:hypothetical protein